MKLNSFPFYRQHDFMDCGPTCLRMVAKHYGKSYSLESLREKSYITRAGVSLLGISDAAETIGFRTLSAQLDIDTFIKDAPLPAIAYWRQRHFVVVYKVKKDKIWIADPGHGKVSMSTEEFLDGWADTKREGKKEGIMLLLEPTPAFYEQNEENQKTKTRGWGYWLSYLKPHKRYIVQLVLGLLAGSIIQLILPFLTQSIVDIGIISQDINFIYLVMMAQLMLFAGKTIGEFLNNWITLYIGSKINIAMVSDFLIKLMKLPISFFDKKVVGEIMQRMEDHKRLETLLTSGSIGILFSFLNLIVYAIILAWFDLQIFWVFLAGSILYIAWITLYLNARAKVDYKRFDQMSANQSSLIELMHGMQEIKMNNAEKQNRWKWERIRAKLFKTSLRGMAIEQYQSIGSNFINEVKNILITILAAKAVIDGSLTLGMMLSIQYIIGQLNTPLAQIVSFTRSVQDVKIGIDRTAEIYKKEEEEPPGSDRIAIIPESPSLHVDNVSFQYDGPHSEFALKDVSLIIPHGKVTAIVGASGSGKTTLLKLLLKFYDPTGGEVRLKDINLKNLSHTMWRQKCGTVLQEGYIFSDTIAKNIGVSDEVIDKTKLVYAVKVANIQDYIDTLPLGYNTKIGIDGQGLSQGQKQRILIARSVYKEPEFIFFDEATNALDANNEKVIMENLDKFFKGRTVVVVAHRLSTVKNADQIIVLAKGHLVESGTHNELAEKKGAYYELVKNQLELGN